MSRLSQNIGGIHYKSPFVVASSPLTDNVDLIKEAEENGAGAVSTKLTMLVQPIKGVRKMYAERGMFNFNPSDKRNDFEEGLELVRKAREATAIVIWTNMAGPGEDVDGWIKLGKALEEAGADALELNFNCPNFIVADNKPGIKPKVGVSVGKDPALVFAITAGVKSAVKIPVWPKVTTDGVDIVPIVKAVESAGADGVVINVGPLGAPPIDIFNSGRPKMATMKKCSFGGLCGPANRPVSNRFVATVAKNTNLRIAGGGGVSEWSHAVESIMFGSSLITMCSKLLWDGFPVLKKMCAQFERFMEENGHQSIEDMRGLALKTLVTNDSLEYDSSPAQINNEKCTGCGACERIGACRAIAIINKKAIVDEEKCISCGLCASLCPSKAIYF